LTTPLVSSGKLLLTTSASYVRDTYDNNSVTIARTDETYRLGVDVSYVIKTWLSARLAYEYENYKDGSAVGVSSSYNLNRLTASVSVGY